MRHVPVLVAVLAIAGCADSPSQPSSMQVAAVPAASASAPQQVCHKETPTGSNLVKTVCEPAMSDAERRIQLDQIQNQIRLQTPQRPAGGV